MERLQCAAVRCVECSKGGNAGSEISQFVVTLGAEILSGRRRRWEFSHCPLTDSSRTSRHARFVPLSEVGFIR